MVLGHHEDLTAHGGRIAGNRCQSVEEIAALVNKIEYIIPARRG